MPMARAQEDGRQHGFFPMASVPEVDEQSQSFADVVAMNAAVVAKMRRRIAMLPANPLEATSAPAPPLPHPSWTEVSGLAAALARDSGLPQPWFQPRVQLGPLHLATCPGEEMALLMPSGTSYLLREDVVEVLAASDLTNWRAVPVEPECRRRVLKYRYFELAVGFASPEPVRLIPLPEAGKYLERMYFEPRCVVEETWHGEDFFWATPRVFLCLSERAAALLAPFDKDGVWVEQLVVKPL